MKRQDEGDNRADDVHALHKPEYQHGSMDNASGLWFARGEPRSWRLKNTNNLGLALCCADSKCDLWVLLQAGCEPEQILNDGLLDDSAVVILVAFTDCAKFRDKTSTLP
jgi:hypothetical protein